MYFGDTEVWRTSTAEPTAGGIEWTYVKDMTHYLYLWKQPQKLIFDLGNLVDDTYTGLFNTTLTATFLTSDEPFDAADLIIPVSGRRSASDSASVFNLPDEKAINTLTLPRNAKRAVFTIAACGQAEEEFWWSNVLQSSVDTFKNTTGVLPGFSAWREIRLYIDGHLAGLQSPFPVIFTGGVAPGLWRPIVGIQAFDLQEYEVDITAWLGVLSDGEPHTFEIKVVGLLDDGKGSYSDRLFDRDDVLPLSNATVTETVGRSWLVTGKILLWLDEPGSITTGDAPRTSFLSHFVVGQLIETDDDGKNVSLRSQIRAEGRIVHEALITTASDWQRVKTAQWFDYRSETHITRYGVAQDTRSSLRQGVAGRPEGPLDDIVGEEDVDYGMDVRREYFLDFRQPGERTVARLDQDYKMDVRSEYFLDPEEEEEAGKFRIEAAVDTRYWWRAGGSVFASGAEEVKWSGNGLWVSTVQKGEATYEAAMGRSWGTGTTRQEYSLTDGWMCEFEELYHRDVTARDGWVVNDEEREMERKIVPTGGVRLEGALQGGAQRSVRELLGRGPGRVSQVLVQTAGVVEDGDVEG
jgi:hypothetical protein